RRAQVASADRRVPPTTIGIRVIGKPLQSRLNLRRKIVLGLSRHDRERRNGSGGGQSTAGEIAFPMTCGVASCEQFPLGLLKRDGKTALFHCHPRGHRSFATRRSDKRLQLA